jgi:hypothetical protein
MPLKRVFETWWPLAASWILMAMELPVVSAVIARLAEPEINLAAYGGVVFPLALIIESPVIMLLAASTTLSKDTASYQKIRRFMLVTSAALSVLHVLVAFTPLYYFVVEGLLGAPQEIIEPARIGLQIMLPWTWAIAYRRFNQGVLIRFGHSRTVGVGTLIRLAGNWLVLIAGYLHGGFAGIVVGASAVAFGVTAEAIYVGFTVRPVVQGQLARAEAVDPPLDLRTFLAFYIPLALTSLLNLLANPINTAAISRMPEALVSLAVWPVLSGMVFIWRSMGFAYNEVVVALLDEQNFYPSLKRFTLLLASATTLGLLLITATPLSRLWFEGVSALDPQLADLARSALWFALPLPALNVSLSWFQGTILHGRRTRFITEAVVVYLLTSAVVLGSGVIAGKAPGLYVGISALTLSVFTQTLWLWLRSRPIRQKIQIQQRMGSEISAQI